MALKDSLDKIEGGIDNSINSFDSVYLSLDHISIQCPHKHTVPTFKHFDKKEVALTT